MSYLVVFTQVLLVIGTFGLVIGDIGFENNEEKDAFTYDLHREIEMHQHLIKELETMLEIVTSQDKDVKQMREMSFRYDSLYLEMAEKANETYSKLMRYFGKNITVVTHGEVSTVRRKKQIPQISFPWPSYTESSAFDQALELYQNGNQKEAHDLFMESWRIFNITKGYKIGNEVEESTIMKYIQLSSV